MLYSFVWNFWIAAVRIDGNAEALDVENCIMIVDFWHRKIIWSDQANVWENFSKFN